MPPSLLIIGGPAGLMAARAAAHLGLKPLGKERRK